MKHIPKHLGDDRFVIEPLDFGNGITGDLGYDCDLPFLTELHLQGIGDMPTTLFFWRASLMHGLIEQAGTDEVMFDISETADNEKTLVWKISNDEVGEVLLECDYDKVKKFVGQTVLAVPPGTELDHWNFEGDLDYLTRLSPSDHDANPL